MRVKEAITKIKQHSMFAELQKVMECDLETYKKRYAYRIYKYRRGNSTPTKYDDFSEQMNLFLGDDYRKQLPIINVRYEFNFGIWGKVVAFIKVGINDYSWSQTKISTSLHFDFLTHRPSMLWNLKFELPLNLDLNNPIADLKKLLSEHFYTDGLIATLQRKHDCTKKDVIFYYKNTSLNCGGINESKVLKKLEKRFNVIADWDVTMDDVIIFVNANGKLQEQKTLAKIDYRIAYDFEGDMDEIESEVFGMFEPHKIYIN